MYVCMYVCVYIYICMYIYIYIYIYISQFDHAKCSLCVCVCVCVNMHNHVGVNMDMICVGLQCECTGCHLCMYACMRVYICTCIRMFMRVWICICIRTHTITHTHHTNENTAVPANMILVYTCMTMWMLTFLATLPVRFAIPPTALPLKRATLPPALPTALVTTLDFSTMMSAPSPTWSFGCMLSWCVCVCVCVCDYV